MEHSRRSFIKSSLTLAGMGMAPQLFLGSCTPWWRNKDSVMEYIGEPDHFEYFRRLFKKVKGTRLTPVTLESSLSRGTGMVLLNSGLDTRSAYLILLFERGKDVLTTFPLANNLSEYAKITEFSMNYGRVLGLLNPLAFYPSFRRLKEIIAADHPSIDRIQVNCHPEDLGNGFRIDGPTGTAQVLQRMCTLTTGSYPLSVFSEKDDSGHLSRIQIEYKDFKLWILFDRSQVGWTMQISGENYFASTDHTGMLAMQEDVEPDPAPDPDILDKAICHNIEDFLRAVSERSEPLVNHIDGLSSIVLNGATRQSFETGRVVNL